MIRKINFLFIVLLFAVSNIAFSQNAKELRIDSFFNETLAAGQEIWYSVKPTETGILVVETTGNIDTYLEAYDSGRKLITENDDGGEGSNAKIEIRVTRDATYLFKLRGYSDSVSGLFRILAYHRSLPQMVQLQTGSFIPGNINPGAEIWYSITAAASGILTVETDGSTDTYMEAYDTQFALIAEDDDGGEGTNAKIEVAAASGSTFYFKVKGYSESTNGPYRIFANFAAFPPDERNTERSRSVPVRLGEVANVFFHTSSESRWFIYQSTRANVNFVVQTKGSMDTYMKLYDSNGILLAEDDDSGDGANALIRHRLNAGTYYIEVSRFTGNMGRCTLHTEIWP
ncbi:MAG: hypothetical protein FWD22_06420 [Treponema sp.]|nr:hypothetical protein [Treponema sp.]